MSEETQARHELSPSGAEKVGLINALYPLVGVTLFGIAAIIAAVSLL